VAEHQPEISLSPTPLPAYTLRTIMRMLAVMASYAWAFRRGLPPAAIQRCSFTAWLAGHVALAFISRTDHQWIFRYGTFLNAWAVSAIGILLLAIYVPPLREGLHFAAISPRGVLASAGLAVRCIVPSELMKCMQHLAFLPATERRPQAGPQMR
jgi:P-type Ca2+ transporter type 2C